MYTTLPIFLAFVICAFSQTSTQISNGETFSAYDSNGNFNATVNDINTLTYALTLENLEAHFYNALNNTFNLTDFENDATIGSQGADVYYKLGLIRDHENFHVSFLSSAISSAGFTPASFSSCTYAFESTNSNTGINTGLTSLDRTQFPTVFSALQYASNLEAVGVGAYDGAITAITTEAYRTRAAEIATVEARHVSYLLNLIGQVPFPNNLDGALSPSAVLGIAGPLIRNPGTTNCYVPQASAGTIPLNVTFNQVTQSPTPSGTGSSGAASFNALSAFVLLVAGLVSVWVF